MKSIQQANIDDALRHMDEAKNDNDVVKFEEAKSALRITLDAIKNSDLAAYDKYVHLLDEEI